MCRKNYRRIKRSLNKHDFTDFSRESAYVQHILHGEFFCVCSYSHLHWWSGWSWLGRYGSLRVPLWTRLRRNTPPPPAQWNHTVKEQLFATVYSICSSIYNAGIDSDTIDPYGVSQGEKALTASILTYSLGAVLHLPIVLRNQLIWLGLGTTLLIFSAPHKAQEQRL